MNKLDACALMNVLKRVQLINGSRASLIHVPKCHSCFSQRTDCVHLSYFEITGIKDLRLVCKRWNRLLLNYVRIYFKPLNMSGKLCFILKRYPFTFEDEARLDLLCRSVFR